jgi:hypothetical protein
MLAGLHDNLLSLFGTPIGEMFDWNGLLRFAKYTIAGASSLRVLIQ